MSNGPLGATVTDGGVEFGVWAPEARRVDVAINDDRHAMTRDADGVWTVTVPDAGAGTRYGFSVDGGDVRPDPYSRFQPDGVHGRSEVIDPSTFVWTDDGWAGIHADGQVIYELHIGTFTPAGTFVAAIERLPELRDLGVTAIEVMPVAQCPGMWNWGYDGVDLFAPSHAYGRPDDLRALVDAAHAEGLGVILDVVYNHLGPEGNYLHEFSRHYFSTLHETAWGAGMNWDGNGSGFVRRFAIDNAVSWIREYHVDGLRLDATHALLDDSPVHIVEELTDRARQAAGDRSIYVIAEDGRHEIGRARVKDRGGEGLDATWADDFHHEIRVHLTNAHENYYAAYSGSTAAIAETITIGYGPLTNARGDVSAVDDDDPASSFVFCLQNHDQVGNRPYGDRLHHEISMERYVTSSALLLLAPETPLLFMGQEFAATTPFLYFTDHPPELGTLVTAGRRREFAGFGLFADESLAATIPDPQAESTFLRSKLRDDDRELGADVRAWYRDLLGLRRGDPVFRQNDRLKTRAIPLTGEAVAIHRWWGEAHRLVIANFGPETELDISTTRDLSALASMPWHCLATSTDGAYGGNGRQPVVNGLLANRHVVMPARSAAVFAIGDGVV